MAIMILTKNVDPDMFSLLVDKYGTPKDVSTERDKADGISSLFFCITGFKDHNIVQIIGIVNEDGSMELSDPLLMFSS